MSGFDNEVMYARGERLQQSNAQDILLMQQTATDVSNINHTGNPNGAVAANPSSLSHDPTNGNVWVKATGTGNTGWVLFATGVTLTADDTNSLSGIAFNLFGQKAGTVPAMDTLVAGGNFLFEDRTWETQYVVSGTTTAGLRGTFSTIQAAINQAVSDGAAAANYKRIFIRFGTYNENLTIPAGIILQGEVLADPSGGILTPFQTTVINGNHGYTGACIIGLEDLNFVTTTGSIFAPVSSPTAFLCYNRNCFFAALDNTSPTFDTTGVSGTYISGYECTFAGTADQIMIKMPAGGSLKLVDCYFPQAGIISTSGASLVLIDVQGVGEIASTNSGVYLSGCQFSSNNSTYNISGTTTGTAIGCFFSAYATAAIQNTSSVVMIGCGAYLGTSTNKVLYQTGTVYKQPMSNMGNIMQGVAVTASAITPYTVINNVYFVGVNATAVNSQVLLDTIGSSGGFCEGQVIVIKDTTGNAGTNNIVITSLTGILIDGKASVIIDKNYGSYTLRFNGTNFNVIAQTSLNTANATLASGSAISLSTATPANVTSISLPAGTWLVSGLVQYGGTPTVSGPQQASISTTSATHGTIGDNSSTAVWLATAFTVGSVPITMPSYILTVGSTTTVYLVASGVFSGGTMTAYGRISAVKITQ